MPEIVFMGTPNFAVPSLQALLDAGHSIPLLVCRPDRKKGRGHTVQPPPTKIFALQHDIEVFQPEKIRTPETRERLAAVGADFFVVIAYGRILPADILAIPHKACINVHASLLPRWRGAAPIQFSLLHGDSRTGICTMHMDEGMDTGDILLVRETDIDPDEKVDSLEQRLSRMGAELIVETIRRYDEITPGKQDHDQATYTRLLKKEDRLINWEASADDIYNQFRALSPSPGVVTRFREKRLIIRSMSPAENTIQAGQTPSPGCIMEAKEGDFQVACGEGTMSVHACQPESRKEMSARDFINGYQVKPGEFFGGRTKH